MRIAIPGREPFDLEHLVCDLNGTLAEDGLMLDGVIGRLVQLGSSLSLHLLTADTHGTAAQIVDQLHHAFVAAGVPPALKCERVHTGADKERYVQGLGAERVVAVGNGANDVAMLRSVALSILVLGTEGAAVPALLTAHVVVTSAAEALDLLLFPERLVATLRP